MPRPRALSDEAIEKIQRDFKAHTPFERGRSKLRTYAKRYNVSVSLISKVICRKIAYTKKAAPSDVKKRVRSGRRV